MSLEGRKVFVRKSGGEKGGELYKWTPFDNQKVKKNEPKGVFFCTTPLGSQGNDFISTYSFVTVVTGSGVERQAYVQCDYVE
jgi:hypothetical protein